MPGTVVRDALEPDLLDGVTLTTAAGANQAGTAREIGWSGETRFELTTAGKSGTTPTIAVDIQGSEKSDFSDDVVTLGTITAVDVANGSVRGIDAFVNSRYVRAVSTVTGTSGVYTGSTLYAVPFHDRRQRSANPTAKTLV
jgi:hypothetical protein